MAPQFAHLIDGETVAGSDHFDVLNAATGAPCARCPSATRAELERTVAAAAAAFRGPWRSDEDARRTTLRRMAEVARAAAAELGRLGA